MGCTKNNCPFLHLKPRQSGPVPPQSRPAMTSTRMPVHSAANQTITNLHGNIGPPTPQIRPIQPPGPRASASARPPLYNGPGLPFNQGPYMSGPRPIGYEGLCINVVIVSFVSHWHSSVIKYLHTCPLEHLFLDHY